MTTVECLSRTCTIGGQLVRRSLRRLLRARASRRRAGGLRCCVCGLTRICCTPRSRLSCRSGLRNHQRCLVFGLDGGHSLAPFLDGPCLYASNFLEPLQMPSD